MLAGWGGAVALVGGVITYLWLASDSIMDELKDQRPQITIAVKPKRRNVEPAIPKKLSALEAGLSKLESGESPAEAESSPESENSDTPAAGESPSAEKTEGGSTEELKAALASTGPVKMNPHPDIKLIEETDQGPLPKIDEAGRKPWQVYARPFNKADKRARIALVITQLGLSPQITQQAITELPAPVTLGFAPYTRSLADWVQQARDNGHEVLIGLPMEPSDYPRNDPGPNGLMLANNLEENTKRLNWVLSRATGYVGVFNFMGTRFTGNKRALLPIVQQLKNRGLMILDTKVTPFSVLATAAGEVGLPYTAIETTPDAEPNRGQIDRQLKALVELATQNKQVVAHVRPFPITLLRLKNWIKRLDAEKVVLVPLSALARIQRPKS